MKKPRIFQNEIWIDFVRSLDRPLLQELNLFTFTYVGDLFMISKFFIVRFLVGPRKVIGDFGLSMIIDENVDRPDISNFSATHVEHMGRLNDGEDKVPKLYIIEVFLSTILIPVRDLIIEQKGKVVVIDLD